MSFTMVEDFPHKASKTKQGEVKTLLSKSDYTLMRNVHWEIWKALPTSIF